MWTDLSSVLSQCTRVTDGQKDRRTDRILIAIPRLHYMQRGKNYNSIIPVMPDLHFHSEDGATLLGCVSQAGTGTLYEQPLPQ